MTVSSMDEEEDVEMSIFSTTGTDGKNMEGSCSSFGDLEGDILFLFAGGVLDPPGE